MLPSDDLPVLSNKECSTCAAAAVVPLNRMNVADRDGMSFWARLWKVALPVKM